MNKKQIQELESTRGGQSPTVTDVIIVNVTFLVILFCAILATIIIW